MLILALLAGCVRDAPFPYLGECARYPDGAYDYGQIGIGTCLAGPTELEFAEAPDGGHALLITNANPYKLFTGGSLLALDWDAIDLDADENLVDDLSPAAVDLPDFAGGLGVEGELGIVAVRLSEDALLRQHYDEVYALDLTDPRAPVLSGRGDRGGPTVEVQSDPNDVVIDPSTGLAFVSNRTSHSISLLDVTGDPIEVVPPWPEYVLTGAGFTDADGSGSTAELADIDVVDEALIPDDFWTLSWVAGTWRVWVPGADGVWRTQTTGDGTYVESAIGLELDPAETDGKITEVRDPFYYAPTGSMWFAEEGAIRYAVSDDYLGDWRFASSATLKGRDGEWDESLGGPSVTASTDATWVFYDGHQGEEWGIGASWSADGVVWTRADGDPLVAPAWDHEAERVSDPHVVYDAETDRWRMFYSAFDGVRWTIGHATSEDLSTWETDEEPVFALEGVDAAAPAVTSSVGAWKMWYARGEGGTWSIGAAESADGYTWVDLGTVAEVDEVAAADAEPPGPAVQASVTGAFRVEAENAGSLLYTMTPGSRFSALDHGWEGTVVAGAWLSPGDAGPDSNGGIRMGSVDLDSRLAWLTLVDSGGTERIGVADIADDGSLVPREGAVFEGTDGFDRDGAGSPVVTVQGSETWMFYAGKRGGKTSIGLAVSADGESWSRVGRVLAPGDEWDSVAVVPGSVEEIDGGVRLWYSGSDGEVWRVGAATTADGRDLSREKGDTHDWVFGTGIPGEWDDSGVRDPWVLEGTDAEGRSGLHLWYAGSDGDDWRGGYAFRPTGEDFERAEHETTGETRPVVAVTGGLFHPDGVLRPVLVEAAGLDGGQGFLGWFTGLEGDTPRVGGLRGREADRLQRVPRLPTVGDTITFATERGDPDALAVPLDGYLDGRYHDARGLTSLALDAERGFLYAVSKLQNSLFVLDVRDDSTDGAPDLNYLDIEAILPLGTTSGLAGLRQVVPLPGTDRLYLLSDAPECIEVIDISELTDEPWPRRIEDTLIGWLPAPRGAERDKGDTTQSSVGPAQLLVHPDGRRLFVSNFNANSVTVYDLTLGPYGQLVAEIPHVGENPYAMAFSPDATRIAVANYTGTVDGDGLAESTLAVVDVDLESPTYLAIRTRVVNR